MKELLSVFDLVYLVHPFISLWPQFPLNNTLNVISKTFLSTDYNCNKMILIYHADAYKCNQVYSSLLPFNDFIILVTFK